MNANQKFVSGLALAVIGGLGLILLGLLLSSTLIGACIGIPMVIAGVAFWITGALWAYKAKAQMTKEAIAEGVRAGIETETAKPATSPNQERR
jgi:hypothetical protein